MKTLRCLALICSVPAVALAADAPGEQRIVVPLTDPSRPVQLEIGLYSGNVTVSGFDGREVVVLAKTESQRLALDKSGGMKRIPNTALGLSVEESQNHVEISGQWHERTVEVEIQVPRRTSASISTVNGDIVVRNLAGELELGGTNGGIEATGIRGSVVASTTNGEVLVTFTELTPNKAMSFTTFNGNVDVAFPAGLRADLRIDSGRGEILTDFDVDVQPSAPEVTRGDGGGGYRVDLARDVRAKVGGGGPAFHFKTFNGDVLIRKKGS